MRGAVWVLLLFATGVAVAMGAHLNDGYAVLVFPPWRVDVSLNLLLFVLLLVFVFFYLVLRTAFLLSGMPRRAAAYRRQRQQAASGQVFQEAVRLLFEGRFGQAMKRASDAWEAGIAPGLSALIAARAAQRMRESAKQQTWLARAKADDVRNEPSALMLEAEMMIEDRNFDAALAALVRLQARHGRHIAALRLEMRARQGLEDHEGVLKLLRQLAKRRALPPAVVAEIATAAHLANLGQRGGDADYLRDYLKRLPPDERVPRVVLAAAGQLAGQGETAEAAALLEACLARGGDHWQPALLDLYGRLTGGDLPARIGKGELWLMQYPQDADLLLALGRMCLNQRLWGKAENYLDASLAVAGTPAARLELARLCDQLGREEEANRHYRAIASPDHSSNINTTRRSGTC